MIHRLELGPMENFIYLIEDYQSKRVAIVDPAWEPTQILALAAEKGLIVTDILLTHSHHDHINAIDDVLQHHDAELHLTHSEAQFWGHTNTRPTLHHGGDTIHLGKTEIKVLHTPGHTPGSACFHIGDELITGDTLFVFGCGRCNLPGGDPNIMFHTLNKMCLELPNQTIILPGHNYAVQTTATMAEQKRGNPFLHITDQTEFVHFRTELHGKHRISPFTALNKQQTNSLFIMSQ